MDALLGLFLLVATVCALALVIGALPMRRRTKALLQVGLALRVLGGLAYLYVIGAVYGVGDYLAYFSQGVELARGATLSEAGSLFDLTIWTGGRWWGTGFVERLTGVVVLLIGPTLPGAFILFSLVSYVGIVAMGLAFHRAYPLIPVERYFVWIALFPSLWFWPAALGKDALVLCGVGLATLGFVGKRGHPRWLLLAFGVALVFAIRPQVAATLILALALGQWLGAGLRWTPMRMLQGALFVAVGVGVISMSSGALGVELFNPDEVETYLGGKAEDLNRGGSALGGETVNPWLAPINVLFRPFFWEARGITTLLAATEVLVLWGLAWYRRREIKAFVRGHRKSRLFWTGVVFILAYATALGMSLTNVGIIARQRVHILPFIFMAFAGASAPARSGRHRRRAQNQPPSVSNPTRAPVKV